MFLSKQNINRKQEIEKKYERVEGTKTKSEQQLRNDLIYTKMLNTNEMNKKKKKKNKKKR